MIDARTAPYASLGLPAPLAYLTFWAELVGVSRLSPDSGRASSR